MHIHVVAASGTGMGALAGLLRELGHTVSGSDLAFDPPMGPALEAWGIRCLRGFDPKNLEPTPDLVVVGNVCRRDNVEVVAAQEQGLRLTHIAGALSEFALAGTSPLVVAGTHGKTTTSAITSFLLDAAGFAPGFLIGGIPKNFSQSFRPARPRPGRAFGDSASSPLPARKTPFVVEGDEYDTAFFEKTAKFLHYGAEVAIVTSIEHDHIDIYPTLDSYHDAFRRFVAGVPEHGLIVACCSEKSVVQIVSENAVAPIAWYALEGEDTHGQAPHWLAAPAEATPDGTTFDLFAGGVACGRFAFRASGRHNLKNALAAIAAAAQGYGAKVNALAHALARFEGVKRRLDLLGRPSGVSVYDDFAHHPTAVRETLRALRERHPVGRLFAVFEPRSATACRNTHQKEYAECFDAADEVHLAPLGRDLPEDVRLDVAAVADAIRARGRVAEHYRSIDAIIVALAQRAQAGDVVALLSNGAFGGIYTRLLQALG
jgi:UDP-N-acetylmuramate: L-alanyl-gamma-D-glutamyl-meso-diaminopimelate ligase